MEIPRMKTSHRQAAIQKTKLVFLAATALLILFLNPLSVTAFSAYDQEDDARHGIATLWAGIIELKSREIPTVSQEILARQAQEAFESKDFTRVRVLVNQAGQAKHDAFTASDTLSRVKDLITQGEQRGLTMTDTRNMMFLALRSFQRGDFAPSLDRAAQSELLANVELKSINWRWVFTTYKWRILSSLLALAVIFRLVYAIARRTNINKKLADLKKEEIAVIHLVRDIKHKHFNKKELSGPQFHKSLYTPYHRLSKIREEMAEIWQRRAKQRGLQKEREFIQQEEQKVMGLIKLAQEDHFVNLHTSQIEYDYMMEEYHNRLSEIENNLITLGKESQIGGSSKPRMNMLRPLQDTLMRIMIPEEKPDMSKNAAKKVK